MLLSVSVRLVLKVLDEIQYHSEIPDSTSWESNSDSMTAVYLTELYICFSLILHLLTRKQGWVLRLFSRPETFGQYLLAWQLHTIFAIVSNWILFGDFSSHASNGKILYSVKASTNFKVSKVFRLLDTLTRLVFS